MSKKKHTIIFISQRVYHQYNFAKVYNPETCRFVAVLDEVHYPLFPEQQKEYFAKLYHIPQSKGESFIETYALNYLALAEIVKQEIELAGGVENVSVLCIDEFNLLNAGKIRDEFGIVGGSYETLLGYRDKERMKQRLQEKGIRVPRFQHIDLKKAYKNPEKVYQEVINSIGMKFVIKPAAGAGSITTEIIDQYESFKLFLENYHTQAEEYEVEEFIEGKLYHCDSLVQDDKVLFSVASQYLYPNLDFLKGKPLASIPLHPSNSLKDKIEKFSEQALTALGKVDGATHMEIFVKPQNELVFLEVAARIPGGNIIPNYEHTFGININDAVVRIHLGEKLDVTPKTAGEYAVTLKLAKTKGKIVAINKPPFKSQYVGDWFVKEGDVITRNPRSLLDFAAIFSIYNSDYEILWEDFQSLKDYQPFVLE